MLDALSEVGAGALSLALVAVGVWVLSILLPGPARTASVDAPPHPAQVAGRPARFAQDRDVVRGASENVAGETAALVRPVEHRIGFIDYLHGQNPRVHCVCGDISHALPDHAACRAWMTVHRDVEESLATFTGGRS